MLYLLSPAKTLDYQTPIRATVRKRASEPVFIDHAAELIGQLSRLTPPQVAQLMDLSDELAALNVARYGAWSAQSTDLNSRPAALAFDGDVYGGLQAPSMTTADLDWAQRHLVILSGLYGALRPLDRLQPYRLEMGTRLENPRGRDLYAYWGDTIAEYLNERQAEERAPVVVNLASQEYFRAADRRVLRARVVECVFEDWKSGQYKVISFFAKRARGLMARWAVQHRVASVRRLASFEAEGYGFDPSTSTRDRLVFRRRAE
jgi:hypothetical protein